MAVIPMLAYEDGAAAIDWLDRGLRLRASRLRFKDDDGTVVHAELETGQAGPSCSRRRRPTT